MTVSRMRTPPNRVRGWPAGTSSVVRFSNSGLVPGKPTLPMRSASTVEISASFTTNHCPSGCDPECGVLSAHTRRIAARLPRTARGATTRTVTTTTFQYRIVRGRRLSEHQTQLGTAVGMTMPSASKGRLRVRVRARVRQVLGRALLAGAARTFGRLGIPSESAIEVDLHAPSLSIATCLGASSGEATRLGRGRVHCQNLTVNARRRVSRFPGTSSSASSPRRAIRAPWRGVWRASRRVSLR